MVGQETPRRLGPVGSKDTLGHVDIDASRKSYALTDLPQRCGELASAQDIGGGECMRVGLHALPIFWWFLHSREEGPVQADSDVEDCRGGQSGHPSVWKERGESCDGAPGCGSPCEDVGPTATSSRRCGGRPAGIPID